jgi:drug/metabolite transporter, DME family
MGAALLGGGMMLYTIGSRAVPAAEIGLLTMVEIMLAPVWVWLILSETTTRGTLAGGSILLAAIAINALSGMRRAAPAYLPRRKNRDLA